MDPLSPALIVEEQLNVAFRLVVNFSPLITIEELRTIRSRLARMDEAVGRVLATKALESRAQAVIGTFVSPHHPPCLLTLILSWLIDYVNVLRTQTASSSISISVIIGT